MVNNMMSLVGDYTFQIVAMGALALGVLAGASGVFAVLRKQSLIGDSIAHSSLAGIALAFLFTQTKNTEILLLGALIIGIMAAFFTDAISQHTKVNFESSMALVMATFFGVGLILLTEIQKYPNSNQAGLERFLFGQAATILAREVYLTMGVTLVVLVLMGLFWKEIKIYSFDPYFAQALGMKIGFINFLLSAFTVVAVIMGIQMVGVVLMSALLIAPAVAARQWTNSLAKMTILAAVIGGISGVLGTVISSTVEKFPTGPAIVFCVSLIVMISLLLAPGRGLLHKRILRQAAQNAFAADMVLLHLFVHHGHKLGYSFTAKQLEEAFTHDQKSGKRSYEKVIKNLLQRQMIERQNDDVFVLTEKGLKEYFSNRQEGEGE